MTSSFPSAAAMNSRSMTTCRAVEVIPKAPRPTRISTSLRHPLRRYPFRCSSDTGYALFISPNIAAPAPHHSSRDYFDTCLLIPSNTRLAHARNPAPANGNFCSITRRSSLRRSGSADAIRERTVMENDCTAMELSAEAR